MKRIKGRSKGKKDKLIPFVFVLLSLFVFSFLLYKTMVKELVKPVSVYIKRHEVSGSRNYNAKDKDYLNNLIKKNQR